MVMLFWRSYYACHYFAPRLLVTRCCQLIRRYAAAYAAIDARLSLLLLLRCCLAFTMLLIMLRHSVVAAFAAMLMRALARYMLLVYARLC